MILSMTGFGRSEAIVEGKKITLELKSLNSKSFDLSLKMPARYREKEFELRKILSDRLQRGKVECYITTESLNTQSEVSINGALVQAYMRELENLAADGPKFEYLKMAVRMPDVLAAKSETVDETEWEMLKKITHEAVEKFEDFRRTEGKVLQQELSEGLNRIGHYLQQVLPFETERLCAVKEKYRAALQDFEQVDETRFYQEMAYYTEKLDIAEEKVRLAQHLRYYREVMETEYFNGKKLGFITQEIGREINTLGSKANHAEIQKLVVQMKDELERIKEQTLNVL